MGSEFEEWEVKVLLWGRLEGLLGSHYSDMLS